jgi:DNA-binding transcriptional ArsR family regulator
MMWIIIFWYRPRMEMSNGHSATRQNGIRANGNGNGHGSLPLDWERLARSTAHELRVSILEVLAMDGGRTLSPSDLCRELQIPLSNTNYHVTELAKAGLIELARQQPVRGATEHFYRLAATSGETEGTLKERIDRLATTPAGS